MRRSALAVLLVLPVLAGCGPLATVVDQGTDEPLTVTLVGDRGQGRLPVILSDAELTIAAGDPEDVKDLKTAGVDIMVGQGTGVSGLTVLSGTKPHLMRIRGDDVAVFGVTGTAEPDALVKQVGDTEADTVLVYLALPGTEACPAKDRRDLVARLVEAGADVVAGLGPVGPGGYVKDEPKVIAYGLGAAGGGKGGVLALKIARHEVLRADWTPTTARGPRTGQDAVKAAADWRALRTSCTGVTSGNAPLAP